MTEIIRVINQHGRGSSLVVNGDKLEVVGVLPHGSIITLETSELHKLNNWICEQLINRGIIT